MARGFYAESVLGRQSGGAAVQAVSNASVAVYQAGTSTLVSPLYAAESGGATLSNPLTTDVNGSFVFWTAGRMDVDIVVTHPDFTFPTRRVQIRGSVTEEILTTGNQTRQAGLTLIEPNIEGGTIEGVTMTGITLNSPTINTPGINDPSIDGGAWGNGQIIQASISDSTLANAQVSLGRFLVQPEATFGIGFVGDADTYIERPGADRVAIVAGGSRYFDLNHAHTPITGTLLTLARADANTGAIVSIFQGNGTTGSPFLAPALGIDSRLLSSNNGGIALRSHITAMTGTDGFFIGAEFVAEAKSGWTPTTLAAGPIGVIASGISDRANTTAWGANIKSRIKAGATNMVMCGLEINMQAEPGSGIANVYGIQVVPTTVDTGTGSSPTPSGTSIGYRLVGKAVRYFETPTPPYQWRYGTKLTHGIVIENLSGNEDWAAGTFPLQTTGIAMQVKSNYPGSRQTIAHGIAFNGIDITGYSFLAPKFALQGPNGFVSIGSDTPYVDAPLYLDAQSQAYAIRFHNAPFSGTIGALVAGLTIVVNGSVLKIPLHLPS